MRTNNKLGISQVTTMFTDQEVTEVTTEFMKQHNRTKGFIPEMSNKMV